MPLTCPRTLRRALAAAASLALPAVASAQPAATQPVLLPQQSVAVNPLAIPFGVFSAEYEAALPTPGFTVGIGGTYFSNDGDRDSWAEVKALYYPSETPFRAFSIGLTLGVHSARRDNCVFDPNSGSCRQEFRSQAGATLGVLASYDWLLGRSERFRVGLGLGAKRTLKDVVGSDPLLQVYPDGRFVVGVVF